MYSLDIKCFLTQKVPDDGNITPGVMKIYRVVSQMWTALSLSPSLLNVILADSSSAQEGLIIIKSNHFLCIKKQA